MSDADRPQLSVVIPAYNEARRLPDTLNQILNFLEGREDSWELVVVDDGSSDDTRLVAAKILEGRENARVINNGRNLGKGYSVRHGMVQSNGALVLFTDADNSTPIQELDKLRSAIDQGNQLAIGSRALGQSSVQVHQPWYREMMGKVFNLIVRLLAVRGFRDTQCGFKLFTRRAVDLLVPRQTLGGFGFDVELIFIALRHGLRVAEVPVTWINSPQTTVHPIKAPIKMIGDLLNIRLNSLRGLYD
ncbi:MAG: glycosyltransferase family 2 protein [Candidatus Alcyoniella australis]|nr:glycosyltransferase family 2 protein [Candidatus Alcyoniella australis]